MTPKEAIEILERSYPGGSGYIELKEALDIAMEALQEISDHEIWIKNRMNLIRESRDPNV